MGDHGASSTNLDRVVQSGWGRNLEASYNRHAAVNFVLE